jgi:hypothetical protein
LQPPRTKTFKLSPDPLLIDKSLDIVGLSLDPPQHAAVFCIARFALRTVTVHDRQQVLLRTTGTGTRMRT